MIAVAVKHMLAAGMDADAIVAAIAEMESQPKPRSKGAERTRRWRENMASQNVTCDAGDVCDEGVSPDKESPQTPKKITSSPIPFSDPKGSSFPTKSQFSEFWLAYPLKIGKRDAEKKFDLAIRRIADPNPLMVLLAAVDRAKGCERWKGGFVPNPATWLHQDRWLDEPEQKPPQESARFQPLALEETEDQRAARIARVRAELQESRA
jgi:hypothetical protein